jgi:hypothetical protein
MVIFHSYVSLPEGISIWHSIYYHLPTLEIVSYGPLYSSTNHYKNIPVIGIDTYSRTVAVLVVSISGPSGGSVRRPVRWSTGAAARMDSAVP